MPSERIGGVRGSEDNPGRGNPSDSSRRMRSNPRLLEGTSQQVEKLILCHHSGTENIGNYIKIYQQITWTALEVNRRTKRLISFLQLGSWIKVTN